jgi:triacylglycerol esterase/lipase EstA (alpha/beta hydrolase family)
VPAAPARTWRRPLLVLVALLVVAAAVLAVVVLQRTPAPGVEPEADERPGPVLLVPGYGGGTGALQVLAERLRAENRDVTVVALPGDGTGDLTESAAALGAAADAVLARTGDETVDVVGYSAGGLVARLWAADGGDDVARRVVTLGSPHHGTTIADFAAGFARSRCTVGCVQMTTSSALLAQLNADDETPDGADWVSVWTTEDTVVTPPESAHLEGALNLTVQSICADAAVSHADLPVLPLVHEIVLAQLGTGDPVELGPTDCARLGG